MSAPYTDEEIQQHLAEVENLGLHTSFLQARSATIIRQLLAERDAALAQVKAAREAIKRSLLWYKCDGNDSMVADMKAAKLMRVERLAPDA